SYINWDNMDESSDKFDEEVAHLVLLTGTSVHTHYESSESGASMNGISHELVTTFGYDPSCTYLRRQFYTDKDWYAIIDSQLKQGLPIIYGSTIENSWQGHTYVLDGKSEDMYHINWGWEGNFNGYYELDFLQPNLDNYSDHQSMIINIKPDPDSSLQSFSPLQVVYGWNTTYRTGQINSTTTEIRKNEPLTFTGPVLSFPNVFHGYVNYALVDSDFHILELASPYFMIERERDATEKITVEDFYMSPDKNGWRLDNNVGSFPIEAYSLSDFCRTFGFIETEILPSYRVILVSKEDTETEWKQVLGLNGVLNYVPVSRINSQWASVEWKYNSDLLGIQHFEPFIGESDTRILRYRDYKSYRLKYQSGKAEVYINNV
ncbi:MAG: C10 family peptidase, partial [Prevotella sp.]|nr:C10 family peptidase [Prevotella sp.]